MLYNKVRPHTFTEMVGQRSVVEAVRNQIRKKGNMSVYLFGGQYGSGKTTMARIVALALNCSQLSGEGNPCLQCEHCKAILSGNTTDYMELDAASKNGVEEVRGIIEDTAFLPSFLNKKVYIIDEVHMLTKAAFNSLLKILEEPPNYCVFLLCTTDVKSIPATVRSRAATYTFGQIEERDISAYLLAVAKKQGYEITKEGCDVIAHHSDGALRNALSLLEQGMLNECLSQEAIERMLGVTARDATYLFLRTLLCGDTAGLVTFMEELRQQGKMVSYLLEDTMELVVGLIIYCSSHSLPLGLDKEQAKDLCQHTSLKGLCSLSKALMELQVELKRMSVSNSYILMKLVHICGVQLAVEESALVGRVLQLEKEVQALGDGKGSRTSYDLEKGCDSRAPVIIARKESPPVEDALQEMGSVEEENASLEAPPSLVEEVEERKANVPLTKELTGDVFDLFHLFSTESEELRLFSYIQEEEEEQELALQFPREKGEEHESLDLLRGFAKEDRALWVALYEGGVLTREGDMVVYTTALAPLAALIQTYVSGYALTCIQVVVG